MPCSSWSTCLTPPFPLRPFRFAEPFACGFATSSKFAAEPKEFLLGSTWFKSGDSSVRPSEVTSLGGSARRVIPRVVAGCVGDAVNLRIFNVDNLTCEEIFSKGQVNLESDGLSMILSPTATGITKTQVKVGVINPFGTITTLTCQCRDPHILQQHINLRHSGTNLQR